MRRGRVVVRERRKPEETVSWAERLKILGILLVIFSIIAGAIIGLAFYLAWGP